MTLKLKTPNGDIKIYHENPIFSSDGRSYSAGDLDGLVKEYGGQEGYEITIR